MVIHDNRELEILRECGRRLARILEEIKKEVRPGISTAYLDDIAERFILESGGDPVFKGYRALKSTKPYPCSLCVSINDEVVHAIPSNSRILKEGDIVGLDIGMRWPKKIQNSKFKIQNSESGLITDVAVTVGVGDISRKARLLIEATRESLDKGIAVVRPGIHLGDLGAVIQEHLERLGFGVVRELAGHGVGRELHEEPSVPNWGRRGSGPPVIEGMVLAIEPMATEKGWKVVLDNDGWTFRTKDGGLAAHFEHTVVVTRDGAEILTKS